VRATKALTSIVAGAIATAGVGAPAAAATPAVVKPTQELAELLTSQQVVSAPGAHSSVGTVRATRPITGGQTVLPVVGRASTPDGAQWLRIMVPGRPNGALGWIRLRGTSETTTSWHVAVRTTSRRVLVYRAGRLRRSFSAIVGKPSTPTPHGRFFVEESIRIPPGSAGGPFALALSARSNVLQEFAGGPGQIGIHGVRNLGGTPGTAVSHGCVRLTNRAISWLAARIGPGVPVTVRA